MQQQPRPATPVDVAWSRLSAGDVNAAAQICERLLEEGFDGAACHVLGLSRWRLGDQAKAFELLKQAASARPDDPALQADLGVLSHLQGDWAGAEAAFSRCLEHLPGDLTARQGRAAALYELKRYEDAARAAVAWIEADPEAEEAVALRVRSLVSGKQTDAAAAVAEEWLERDPRSETMLLALADLRQGQQRFEAALPYAKAAADAHPDSGRAQACLAQASWAAGDWDAAAAARGRALELGLTGLDSWAGLNWLSLFDPAHSAHDLLEIHRIRPSTAVARRPAARYPNAADPERRLRVGYLSGEFVSSAAYCFLMPWLSRHDPAQVETFYYMSRPWHDEHTAQFRTLANNWRNVYELGDDGVESLIRRDGVDILVDLSGHFQHNRLTVFTRRPAPVQVSFPNYPGTTGVAEIDYILTDRWTTPEGCENEYAEEPYRLPSGYLVYRFAGVPLTPPPAACNGHVTFGMFQRPGKLHKGVWDAITEILRRAPESRLLIHFGSAELDEVGSAQRARLLGILEDGGVAAERIAFRGSRISPEHLAVVGEADIALDSFPFNGQTTTCDCLWMGVPVISLRGKTHVSRVTPALLDRLGLGELAAGTPAGYVEAALRLAENEKRLAELRAGLRGKMQETWMTGGSRLAREIEQAYRTMWRRWCASQGGGRAFANGGRFA